MKKSLKIPAIPRWYGANLPCWSSPTWPWSNAWFATGVGTGTEPWQVELCFPFLPSLHAGSGYKKWKLVTSKLAYNLLRGAYMGMSSARLFLVHVPNLFSSYKGGVRSQMV